MEEKEKMEMSLSFPSGDTLAAENSYSDRATRSEGLRYLMRKVTTAYM